MHKPSPALLLSFTASYHFRLSTYHKVKHKVGAQYKDNDNSRISKSCSRKESLLPYFCLMFVLYNLILTVCLGQLPPDILEMQYNYIRLSSFCGWTTLLLAFMKALYYLFVLLNT